ncbi:MAG: domain protein beta Propeller [Frankiales bacterium]|nr:domain protein beta Propeller [Frankiales bacterium]
MTRARASRSLAVLLAVGCGLLGLAQPASGYERPGDTSTVPHTSAGAAKDCCVYGSAVSGDGTRVAFQSANSDIAPGGVLGSFDTYVRDTTTGATTRVSVASDGTPSIGGRQYPNIFSDVSNLAMSDNGRFVAFTSNASNLVPGDTNDTWDVFVHDMVTGSTERVSVESDGAQKEMGGISPDVSADGRFVTFSSDGLFVHDRATGRTEQVDVSSTGEPANFYGYGPTVSDDGRWVAFQSSASNLVTDPSEAVFAAGAAIYLRDRQTQTTIRVSGPAPDTKANGYSWMPDISGDGRFVAYYSAATDLVPQDTNRADDVFVYDRVTRQTRRVSVASDGSQASPSGSSHAVSISRDGRFVSFTSSAVNLVSNDTNAASDVFVHDLLLGTTERVSLPTGATAPTGEAGDLSSVSADGGVVAYEVSSTTEQSVRRRERGAPIAVTTATATRMGNTVQVSGTGTFAGAVVSAGDDPATPAPAVDVAGADISRVELAVRTEAEDLRLRIVTPGLPGAHVSGLAGRLACFETGCPPSVMTTPYVGYRVDFSLAGVRHRIVVDEAGAVLSACATVCTPVGAATAQVGGTGEEVVASFPLSLLGGATGQSLSSVDAASTLLGSPSGTTQDLDTVSLPNGTLSAPRVQLAVVPAGSPVTAYPDSETVSSGSFSGAAAAPAGDLDVWIRPCVGTVCGQPVRRSLSTTADPVVPESPYAVLLPLAALGIAAAVVAHHRSSA